MKQLSVILVATFIVVSGISSVAQAYPQYYEINQQEPAQAEAKQRHLPVAWLGGPFAISTTGDPKALATQVALTTLQNRAVVIFFDNEKLASVPSLVQAEFQKQDDGHNPKGPNWIPPKVVFTDPGVTKAIGRVSSTQMSHEGAEAVLNTALQIIRNAPDLLEPVQPVVVTAKETPVSQPVVAPPPPPPDHTINYIVIIIGVPLAWYIFSRGRQRDAGKK